MKIITRLTMFLVAGGILVAALMQSTSCAWFQKNEPRITCAAEDTVKDLPELVTIVTSCAAIAAGAENIVPCILAAAGSKWPEEVIACVANAQASPTRASQTATSSALSSARAQPENLARLRTAVNAKWGKQLGLQ